MIIIQTHYVINKKHAQRIYIEWQFKHYQVAIEISMNKNKIVLRTAVPWSCRHPRICSVYSRMELMMWPPLLL